MIIQDLESKGWKVIKKEFDYIFAIRESTGKKAFFINSETDLSKIEIMRVWTKKGFHPFIYDLKGGISYFDLLFDESVKNP